MSGGCVCNVYFCRLCVVVWLWVVCPAQADVCVGVYVPSTDFVGVMCDG